MGGVSPTKNPIMHSIETLNVLFIRSSYSVHNLTIMFLYDVFKDIVIMYLARGFEGL